MSDVLEKPFVDPKPLTLADYPGINAELVERYFLSNDLPNLLRVFDFIQRCKHRAESLSLAYQHQMFELYKRLEVARAGDKPPPSSRRSLSDASSTVNHQPIAPKRKQIIEDMELL